MLSCPQFVRFSWDIPGTAVSGTYRFKAEFYDVGALLTVKSFEVGDSTPDVLKCDDITSTI